MFPSNISPTMLPTTSSAEIRDAEGCSHVEPVLRLHPTGRYFEGRGAGRALKGAAQMSERFDGRAVFDPALDRPVVEAQWEGRIGVDIGPVDLESRRCNSLRRRDNRCFY